MQYFYDTCALLNKGKEVFNNTEKFYISSITLKELENIKTSATKDPDTKYKARKMVNLLAGHANQYTTITYKKDWDDLLYSYPELSDNNDSRIIISAIKVQTPIVFVTQDLCCQIIAKTVGLDVEYIQEKESDYTGYTIYQFKNDLDTAMFYNQLYTQDNPPSILENEYLILKDSTGQTIDKYKNVNNQYVTVKTFPIFKSKMFGEVKPKDEFQHIAMDSLQSNKITVLRGAAGTGKSYLAMSYLFSQLEKGEIDKIIIFCNTVAANGAARLGFYPGSKDEKLLDSQIGNFLVSKLGGDKDFVIENFISKGKIVLLPLADIRGYDTSGMHAGIYITEAQNMDIDLMKLALQRIGEDSFCILDGDSNTQVDLGLYAGNNNGLRRVSEVFRGESIYGEVTLPNIYRSRIAQIADKM